MVLVRRVSRKKGSDCLCYIYLCLVVISCFHCKLFEKLIPVHNIDVPRRFIDGRRREQRVNGLQKDELGGMSCSCRGP